MNRAMTVTYRVDRGIYVNLTNRCSNRCTFCIRNNGDGAYGSDSLWLEREPSAEEVLKSIFSNDLSDVDEIVFCGYGEPTSRLSVMLEVASEIKSKIPGMPIRVNTNGHSDLINGRNTALDFQGVIDTVSISLNTPNAESYVNICQPVYGKEAFSAMLTFAENVKNYVPCVLLSVVRETLTEDELEKCRMIASDLGVTLKVRNYIS